ncbi:hypothetical protein DFH07DRAFT_974024 [Mycena maculata]|uniref:Uncharacterized protein n=1 Tax=Mycena maculata TaxID=230809 RepID=A0AAD7HAI5_9AGAR|nr:hypothetical protein DFH07DRAFT_974024 [Mycena maculata]
MAQTGAYLEPLCRGRLVTSLILAADPKAFGGSLTRFRTEHPRAATAAGVGLITVGVTILVPPVLVSALNLAGFSETKIVGGSIAAAIWQPLYNGAVTVGSLFSMAQAAAAGGVAVPSVPVQAAGVGATGLGSWLVLGRSRQAAEIASPEKMIE